MKTLYFEGAGWSGADISRATVGNCRIRAAFHLDDGSPIYLELHGSERNKHCSKELYQWHYTGFIVAAFCITDDDDNDDENRHSLLGSKLYVKAPRSRTFEWTERGILQVVNSFGASFDAIKVLPDLGGYRVFKSARQGLKKGTDWYYYGDEFNFDPEAVSRREEVKRHFEELEAKELAADRRLPSSARTLPHSPGPVDYPTLQVWVDEYGPGLLHLLRHFIGRNRHWTVRTDAGDRLADWVSSLTETPLGRYGC